MDRHRRRRPPHAPSGGDLASPRRGCNRRNESRGSRNKDGRTTMSSDKRKVAVVGSGVAGLTAAWVLSKDSDVTLYEADSRLGGHADTHSVTDPEGRSLAIDTGFIVHNDRTYPTLLRLFAELDVPPQESDMSMSIRVGGGGLGYSGGEGWRGERGR